jgi:hypothetical protein
LNVAKETTTVPFAVSSNASEAVAKKHTAHAKRGYVVNRSYVTLLLGLSNTRIRFNASNVAKFVVVYQKLNAFSNESFVNHPSSPPVVLLLVLPAAPSSSRRSKVASKYVFAVMKTLNGSNVPTPRRKNRTRFVSSIVVVVIAVASSSVVVVVVVVVAIV